MKDVRLKYPQSPDGGVTLLHRTHKVGEVSGRRVSKAGRKMAASRNWRSLDADC